jgi:hypothetical protein
METTTWDCAQEKDELLARVRICMGNARNTAVTQPSPDMLEVRGAAHPAWTIWVAILFFPIGLLALLAKDQRVLLFHASPGPSGGTVLRIEGATVPATQRALLALWGELSPAVQPVAV